MKPYPETLLDVMSSGGIVRYHAQPYFHTHQRLGEHVWGVLTLILSLHPNPSMELVRATQFHDAAELWMGDIPYPATRNFAALKKAKDEAEFIINKGKFEGSYHTLSEVDQAWLEWADRTEAVIWMLNQLPDTGAQIDTPATSSLIDLCDRVSALSSGLTKEMRPSDAVWDWIENHLAPLVKQKTGHKWVPVPF